VQRIIGFALILGVIGLVVGYLIFGRVAGEFIQISTLLQTPDNFLSSAVQNLAGINEARQNILISGAVGAGVGVVAGVIRR
jgi:hypothetical protein